MNAEPLFLGVDSGGTKVEAALVDAQGKVLASSRRPAGVQTTPTELVSDLMVWAAKLPQGRYGSRIAALGLGVAGQVDQATGTVRSSPNLPEWLNVPIREMLERAIQVPTFVINDVQAATLGEWKMQPAVGASNMVCLFVGTGIGGGVVSGGRLQFGDSGSAGELGHTVLDYRGPPCHCGNTGCLEAHAGGWAIALRARQAVVAAPEAGSAIMTLAGNVLEAISAETVATAAHRGDPMAQRLVEEVGEALGAGVASVVNAFNPRLVVLGGGVIEGLPELIDMARHSVRQRTLPSARDSVEITKARLGNHAIVIGAALWAQEHLEETGKRTSN